MTKTIAEYFSPGVQERVGRISAQHRGNGLKEEMALSMALFEEMLSLVVRNERTQEALMTELEARVARLEGKP